jgi:hypothetical protein
MPLSDGQYLCEYAEFSGHGPDHIADALVLRIEQARAARDYDVVALLIAKLHAEMVATLETAGALLRAYSLWSEGGGVIGAMMSYSPSQVPEFIEELLSAPDCLTILKLPTTESLGKLRMPQDADLSAYNSSELDRMIRGFCTLYAKEDIRRTYNKVKHGGMYIRHPLMIQSTGTGRVENDAVYVLLAAKANEPPVYASIPVTGDDGVNMARRYRDNIKVVTRISRTLAQFVAHCLDAGIMT